MPRQSKYKDNSNPTNKILYKVAIYIRLSVEDGDKEEQIIVHVTGEVKKEGIVYLEKGARVIDAIEKAGGETKEADLSQINLAYELQDGQKIYVPNKEEKISEYITGGMGNNDIVEENSNRKGEKGEY